MKDVNNPNPFIQFGKTAPVGDDARRKPAAGASDAPPAAEPYTPQTNFQDPSVVFDAMAGASKAAQQRIVEERVARGLAGLPSPETMARFGAQVKAEFPGVNDLNVALIASDVAVNLGLGVPVIKTT
ncbi:MAG: hypothetical protein IPK79_02580 [Vampirovibrionales bacterium]|nr:hypothetical protein [Vampirovibrionales bacterium]